MNDLDFLNLPDTSEYLSEGSFSHSELMCRKIEVKRAYSFDIFNVFRLEVTVTSNEI